MVKRVVIGRSGEEKVVDLIKALSEKASAGNTSPTGNKVLEYDEDFYWGRHDGSTHSMRQIDEDLDLAQGRIDEAEESLAGTQVRLEEAEQTVASTVEDLTRVETVVIPAAVQALEEADAAAQGQFDELDTRLGAFATDEALAPIRQALTDAQTAVETAQGVAQSANEAANAASQAALEAAGIAASKGRVIIQEAEPVGEDRNAANIWIKPIPDDPETEIEEKAITYVYLEGSNEWVPTSSDELAQAAQNALDAREAARQAQQRAETAISNAAAAQSAAEAAQRTADDATLDAREAHNEAVAAQAEADAAQERINSGLNLVNDPSRTKGADGWTASTGLALSVEDRDMGHGVVPALKHQDTGHTTVYTDYFEVDPTQAYEFRLTFDKPETNPGASSDFYFGMHAVTSERTYRPVDYVRTSNSTVASTGTNFYFWYENGPYDGPTELVGYVLPIGVSDEVAGSVGNGSYNARLTSPDTAMMRLRFLNYANEDFDYPVWVSSVSVRAVSVQDLIRAQSAAAAARAAQGRADEAMAEASTAKGLAEEAVREVGDTVRNTVIEYAVNASETAAPTSGWSTATPTRTPGSFVWMRTIVTYADGDTSTASPVLLTGNAGATGAKGSDGAKGDKGATGSTGAQGVSVSSVDPFFRAVSRTAGAPAQPSGMTPSGWVTTEPAWNPSRKLYRAERIVYSNGTVSWTVPTLVAAYEGIVQVQTSVNGKNSITRSTSNASGSGVVAGDAWYKVDSNGDTMAMWIWSGSAWVASKVRNEMIDTIDVNKLKVHDSLEVIGDAVIDKIWADGIAAKAITAQQVTVAPGNSFPDPSGLNVGTRNSVGGGGWSWDEAGRYWKRSPVTGSTTQFNAYLNTTTGYDSGSLTPGEVYRIAYDIWVEGGTGSGGTGRTAIYYRKANGSTSFVGDGVTATPVAKGQWVHVEREWVAPADAISGGFAPQLLSTSATATEVRIRNIFTGPKVGAVLIKDGAITTPKLTVTGDMSASIVNAMTTNTKKLVVTKEAILNHATLIGQTVVDDINVQGKLVGTNGVFTGTVDFANVNVTGELLAEKVITAGLIAGDAGGQRLELDQQGLALYGADPDGNEFELVRVGPSGDNIITAGDTTISPAGVQGPSGDFDSLSVGGDDLSTILDALPRGIVAWGEIRQSSAYDTSMQRQRRAELQTRLRTGRLYRVAVSSRYISNNYNAATWAEDTLHYSYDAVPIFPNNPLAGSYQGVSGRHIVQAGLNTVPSMEFIINTEGHADNRIFWVMYSLAGTHRSAGVRLTAGSNHSMVMSIEDLGPSQDRIVKRWNDNDGGATQDPGTPVQRYTKTYSSNGYRCYNLDGSDAGRPDVVHGLYSGGPSNFRRRGGWTFPNMTNDLSGATVEKIEMYIYCSHTYASAGSTVRPAVWGGVMANNLTAFSTINGWKRNTGRWITIPSSYYNGFKSGSYAGVGVIPSSGSATQFARFNPTGAKIRITYTK